MKRIQPTNIFLFVDYEKAYDSLNWEKAWQILRDDGVPIQLLQGLYQN
jgi:hypothetical protein